MFRIFSVFAILLVSGSAVHAASLTGSESTVTRGTVASVGTCAEGLKYLELSGAATTTLIYSDSVVTPRGAVPTVGQRVFGTVGAQGGCTIQGALKKGFLVNFLFLHGAVIPSSTPPTPPNQGGGSTGNSEGGSGSSFLTDQIRGLAQNLLGGGGPLSNLLNQALGTAVNGGQIPFGGAIASQPIPCAFPPGAICVQVLTPPVPIPVICQPGVCMSFLNGPPAYISQWLLGNTAPAPIACLDSEGVPICTGHPIGMLPGHGSSGPTIPEPPDCGPTEKADSCDNPLHNQYAREAIKQYGGNLMNADIPGIEEYCPNYRSLTQTQKEDFWVTFVAAVEKPESGCDAGPGSFSPEPDLPSPSQGLLQLSYGDVASCHPDACKPISKQNRPSNIQTANQPIYDPKNNLNCGVAIMDCRAPAGITDRKGGMDSYWSVLRRGKKQGDVETNEQIKAATRASPGCTSGGSGPSTPQNPAAAASACAPKTAPQVPDKCGSVPGGGTTPAQKLEAERAVRKTLEQCNINVTSSRTEGAPCGFGQNGVAGGCTDVGGLQCETVQNICDVAALCKDGLTVAGGNESGHKTHDDGDAVDFTADASTNSCISKFTPGADRCGVSTTKAGKKIPYCFKTYKDSQGGLWVLETPVEGYNTGTHWHYCKAGGSC